MQKNGILKDRFLNLTFDKNPRSWFINILKNPSHPKIPYVRSVQIFTNDFTLWQVKQILDYWRSVDISNIEKKIDSQNYMYYHCIKYGFRKNLDVREINIYSKTPNKKTPSESDVYLSSLKEMTPIEIAQFLNENPIQINNNKIMNGFHRACAMMGHILHGREYIIIGKI